MGVALARLKVPGSVGRSFGVMVFAYALQLLVAVAVLNTEDIWVAFSAFQCSNGFPMEPIKRRKLGKVTGTFRVILTVFRRANFGQKSS